jgi:diadenosine tetraphosphate (Ap4A) HIT family hydrolase
MRDRIWIEPEHAIEFADAEPVADIHMIVVPRKHVCTIHQLSVLEQKAIWNLVAEVRERLLTGLAPDSFVVGFSDGLATGQPTCTTTCTWSRAGPAIRQNAVPAYSG